MRRPITATYRLQLRGPQADPDGRAFTFADAEAVVPYLAQLGISHLYLSPILTSLPDSNHGYDVIDPTTVNEELGGLAGLEQLSATAKAAGLGIIIDIVPNHLGVAEPQANTWWWDVLTNGQDSRFEQYFDIDWTEENGTEGRMGLPVLGSPEDIDKLTIDDSGEEPLLCYYDARYPIRPGTLGGTPQEVHDRQCYKLTYWRDGLIGYRRFFSVDGLAGIRQEDNVVFEATHAVLRQLIAADLIDGVRVDHPDGLADPFGYLTRLRQLIGDDKWLVIEKILATDEPLDPRLSVDGTTGYDALREFDGLFVAREAEDHLSMIALNAGGTSWNHKACHAAEYALKKDVAKTELSAEVRRLARAVRRDAWRTASSTVTDAQLSSTLQELVAAIPVYRSDYLSLSRMTATVIADMIARYPSRAQALRLISAGLIAGGEAATRFAQVCGAVTAKGVEDTMFYRANRLVALQEVGGAPGRFGVSGPEFHMAQAERGTLWPKAMTALTTHDTKRGEDTRARIIALSEFSERFVEFFRQAEAMTPAPNQNVALFFWQNIIGVWPESGVEDEAVREPLRQRLHAYVLKAAREAGVDTTWTEQNEDFERELVMWVDNLLDGPMAEPTTEFVRTIASAGYINALGRKLLQLVGPGIPDIYQGTELWEDSLVDPDNRRFVDYQLRQNLLAEVTAEGASFDHTDPRAKLLVVTTAVQLRKERPQSFVGGGYWPVFAAGPLAGRVVGFARGAQGRSDVIALSVRHGSHLKAEDFADTTVVLPEGDWTDRLTGRHFSGEVALSEVFGPLSVSLLVNATVAADTVPTL